MYNNDLAIFSQNTIFCEFLVDFIIIIGLSLPPTLAWLDMEICSTPFFAENQLLSKVLPAVIDSPN